MYLFDEVDDIAQLAVEEFLTDKQEVMQSNIEKVMENEGRKLMKDVKEALDKANGGCKFTPNDPCKCCAPLRDKVTALEQEAKMSKLLLDRLEHKLTFFCF